MGQPAPPASSPGGTSEPHPPHTSGGPVTACEILMATPGATEVSCGNTYRGPSRNPPLISYEPAGSFRYPLNRPV
ncbi:pilus assembly protein, partial [Burkholderia pseudomallei]